MKSGDKQQRVKLKKWDNPRLLCLTQQNDTRPQISQTAAIFQFRHTPSHSVTPSLVFNMVASMSLNLVWAPVLHTEAYRHHLESGDDRWGTASFPGACFVRTITVCLVPSSLTSKDNVMHQSSSQIFPQDQRIRAQVRGWYIFPCFNPISSHELSAAIPNPGRIETKALCISPQSQACLI